MWAQVQGKLSEHQSWAAWNAEARFLQRFLNVPIINFFPPLGQVLLWTKANRFTCFSFWCPSDPPIPTQPCWVEGHGWPSGLVVVWRNETKIVSCCRLTLFFLTTPGGLLQWGGFGFWDGSEGPSPTRTFFGAKFSKVKILLKLMIFWFSAKLCGLHEVFPKNRGTSKQVI